MTDFFTNSFDLRLKPFAKPTAQILEELGGENKAFISAFKDDPAGYLTTRLAPQVAEKIPRATFSAANKFLFSALANKEFDQWLTDYNEKLTQEIYESEFPELNDTKIRTELAEGLLKYGDPSMLSALLEAPQIPPSSPPKEGGGSCCCKKDDNNPLEPPEVNPFGPTPAPENGAAVAVAIAVVVAVAIAVVAALVKVGDVPPDIDLRNRRLATEKVTGPLLVQLSEIITERANSLKAHGKI